MDQSQNYSLTASLKSQTCIFLALFAKRFVYSGDCQKVMKHVEFSVDLEISRDLLSAVNKSKYTAKQRQYKLFAVVNHTGREATKGHYVTDVYHTGEQSSLGLVIYFNCEAKLNKFYVC